MKRTMAAGVVVFFSFHSFISAQEQVPFFPTTAPDSVAQIAADASGLTAVSPEQLPLHGTFWVVQGDGSALLPMPFAYYTTNTPVFYSLGVPGQFLEDNTGGNLPQPNWGQIRHGITVSNLVERQGNAVLDLIGQIQATQSAQPLSRMMNSLVSPPGGFDVGTNDPGETPDVTYTNNFGTNLWLEIWPPATNAFNSDPGSVTVILHNTLADVSYQILSQLSLPGTNWSSEGFVLGSETTNWTPTTVSIGTRTNALFIWALSWIDSTGSGIPDWWLLQYFGTTDVDPYGDPDNDGWNNLQEYQNGTDPNHADTPPKPTILSAVYNATAGSYTLTWQASGLVTSFTVEDQSGSSIGTVSSGNFTFTTSYSPDLTQPVVPPVRRIQANYSGGVSTISDPVSLAKPRLDLNPTFSLGTGLQIYLNLESVPDNLAYIRVYASPDGYSYNAHFDLNLTNFVNGTTVISDSTDAQILQTNNTFILQAFDADGNFGDPMFQFAAIESTHSEEIFTVVPRQYFINASRHLKENLKFLLRSASVSTPFSYAGPDINEFSGQGTDPEEYYGRPINLTDYEYYGFHYYSDYLGFSVMDDLRPVEENYFWRNYVFNTGDITNGTVQTGADVDWSNYPYFIHDFDYIKYQYTGSGTETPLPLAFYSTNATWLYFPNDFGYDPGLMSDLGLYTNSDGTIGLANGVYNYFGLAINSAHFQTYASSPYVTITRGGSGAPYNSSLFVETDQPVLATVGYYFASETPYLKYVWNAGLTGAPPPLPGAPTFSTTNSSPLLVTGFGQMMTVSGWAKEQISNGYSSKFAYLEQYWDQAYTITNGVATATSAGILSPYGDFTPTQPGPAALITLPDIDTGQRGTGVVSVVKLQLDVNHDGVMDLSFVGPDNTSQARPMVWWINNDYEPYNVDLEAPDGLYDYDNNNISCARDLEDFARLWFCGMPALASSNGYTISLSWQNVASGTPKIKLFPAAESDGGIGYLTNASTALGQLSVLIGQISPGQTLGEISPTQSLAFPTDYFAQAGTKHFLFEGSGIGSGELVITITQNATNIIAQTGAWLDLHDVKDFYERAVIADNTDDVRSNWTSTVEAVLPATSSALTDDTNIIILVHGINVRSWDCLQQGDTVFKRLYWAGYQGRFATVKWPCNLLTPIPSPLTTAVFNLSELQGYKASTALTTYLTQLRTRFPDDRLNLLVHSQGNSIVSEAVKNGAPFDTYILTQGAIPNSSYDINAPTNTDLVSYEHTGNYTPEWQPMGYHGAYTNLTGNIVNFYNPNDPVLDIWITDQESLKPSVFFDTSYYFYNRTNSYFNPFVGLGYLVTDPEESRAMVARSRTSPVGQSGPESAHGVIQSAVDLHAHFGFDRALPDDHSAQWTWQIQSTLPYYQQILLQIQPPL